LKKAVFVLALLLAVVWRPEGRELEELALITALAVDRGEAGIEVTAVTAVRAGEDEEPEVLTGAGEDLAGACDAVQMVRATHAYLGQTDQLLLGEELAREELKEVLDAVLVQRELKLDTLLYIVKGRAGEGLAATAPEVAGETPGEDGRGVSLAQVLARLSEGGEAAVPALAAGEDGLLAPAGQAMLSADGLREFRDGP